MEKKRLVLIEQDGYIAYFKLEESQCVLLKYLWDNGYLDEHTNIEFDVDINIVEL